MVGSIGLFVDLHTNLWDMQTTTVTIIYGCSFGMGKYEEDSNNVDLAINVVD